jgi:diguanylate cyclase
MKNEDALASAELLRLTLPMINKHGAGFMPESYAIWYTYVRGGNAALNTEIDALIETAPKLTIEATLDLYQRHIVDRIDHSLAKARAQLSELIEALSQRIGQASRGAGQFGQELVEFGQNIAQPLSAEALRHEVSQIAVKVNSVSELMASAERDMTLSENQIKRLSAELERVRAESLTDPLSQLKNRRAFEVALETMCQDAKNNGLPLSLIMIDIDRFKVINDSYGHVFGDQVIRSVAESIKRNVKGRDVVARFGGEEFVVLLPDTPVQGALAAAEQIRVAIERGRITRGIAGESIGTVTVSAGVAQLRGDDSDTDIIARADQGLYIAKAGGRNRVCEGPVLNNKNGK